MSQESDNQNYQQKKAFFDNLLTIYGRKPVLEALQDTSIPVFRLHLADSNQRSGILKDIEKLATTRNVDIRYHSRDALSRISKNRNQDQGVAADLQCPGYQHYKTFIDDKSGKNFRLVAVDRVTNPQNLGMIIRSVCASPIDGLLLPTKGCAPLSPLVIKASAGTLFKTTILRCESLPKTLAEFAAQRTEVCVLKGNAKLALKNYRPSGSVIYVLGNETEGVSEAVENVASRAIKIPMHNGVESLNVAVTAALLAFREEI